MILWDRRLCLRILDHTKVPTPKRLEISRDGGPRISSPQLARHVWRRTAVKLPGPDDGTGGEAPPPSVVELSEDGEVLRVDGETLKKPFVEKPVNGEDHNIRIYFSKANGGGGRRLFRKIGNKSSEFVPEMNIPRAITEPDKSYIYERFLNTNNSEDVKAYTVGTEFCHAETRKSPVVDGLVRRNTHGKEIRYVTELNKEEAIMAGNIAEAFGQKICGFDLLRVGGKSYVIDVNGWSFVKDNDEYYDQCATILRNMFIREKEKRDRVSIAACHSPACRQESETCSAASPSRRPTGHRSALQAIIQRSPSLSRLTAHQRNAAPSQTNGSPALADANPATAPACHHHESLPSLPSPSERVFEPLPSPVTGPSSSVFDPNAYAPPAAEKHPPKKSAPPPRHAWKLKGMVAVIRHADRTPKQKFKFTFHTKPFVDLLKGHVEEVLLVGEAALSSVLDAVAVALEEGEEDREKLKLLRTSLLKKSSWSGTKVQIKPMFRKRRAEGQSNSAQAPPDEPENTDAAVKGSGEQHVEIYTSDAPKVQNPDEPVSSGGLSRTFTGNASIQEATLSRFSAEENNLVLDKLQLVVKWGGEPTHSARYQSQDLGENMRNELLLLNRHVLEDVAIFSSSERRVTTSGKRFTVKGDLVGIMLLTRRTARIWASAFLDQSEIPEDYIKIRKDLLDDSNAAKDEMDTVKKKLKTLLRDGSKAPPQFAWPRDNMPDPCTVLQTVVKLMRFHKKIMIENFAKLKSGAASSLAALSRNGHPISESDQKNTPAANGDGGDGGVANVAIVQPRWCCQEDAELFRERWEKLFAEFCDRDKVDPSKISELYDTMKFDALHNRQFLEWVFTPGSDGQEDADNDDDDNHDDKDAAGKDAKNHRAGRSSSGEEESAEPSEATAPSTRADAEENGEAGSDNRTQTGSASNFVQRLGLHRRPAAGATAPTKPYFHLSTGGGQTRAKVDRRLGKLRELYRLAKILFDYICPQEYGIEDDEKLKIGLLTSLPLLKEIVTDLEELQASEQAKSFIYFTKESHIYTLLNCILEGGVQTKIQRSAIPELDYLSQICFELYESENRTPADARPDEPNTFDYSIRISISPGAHALDPLDVQLDAKHCIGCVPRRSLTPHADWKQVIETLRAKFHTYDFLLYPILAHLFHVVSPRSSHLAFCQACLQYPFEFLSFCFGYDFSPRLAAAAADSGWRLSQSKVAEKISSGQPVREGASLFRQDDRYESSRSDRGRSRRWFWRR